MKNALTIRIASFLAIAIIGIGFATYYIQQSTKNNNLPKVINPLEVNQTLVDSSLLKVGSGHRIGSFNLIDQNGKNITEKDFEGIVYVTDFFFTTCPSICPIMSNQMVRIQEAFTDEPQVKILSHTVFPEADSVPVLKTYADKYGAINGKWHLVTGEKTEIYRMARKNYFTLKPKEVGEEGDGGKSDFIHTNNFVLIDKEKRIRGYYDGTSTSDVDRLIQDLKKFID